MVSLISSHQSVALSNGQLDQGGSMAFSKDPLTFTFCRITYVQSYEHLQASVIYILDLEGMKFDPTLLSVVTGPYRILWASVYTNYPEWIDKMLIINAPSFMSLLWKVGIH